MCLALRDDHGQFARAVTNYDGLVISALVEAQTPASGRRMAGPCALRGMRSASVADGSGARLAAAVSLVLASAKVRDHVDDGDGLFRRGPVAGAGRRVASRWARQGTKTADQIGFSTAVLLDAVGRQGEVEASVGAGASVLIATEPTETATAAAFAHTAELAGMPDNIESLSEAGRLFGRVAHLIDAVEDIEDDRATGVYNPLTATGTTLTEARRLCDDAVLGVRFALAETQFHDAALVHALLVHELGVAVDRAFRSQGIDSHQGTPPHWNQSQHPGQHQHQQGWQRPGPPLPPHSQPFAATGPQGPPPPGGKKKRGSGPYERSRCLCWQWPKLAPQPISRGFVLGCAACLYECGTCQQCCRDPYPGAWTGKARSACLDNCDCDCCSCCDCNC